MGLRRIWRSVRSLSDRPHHLLSISDIHLGSDLKKGNKSFEPRYADGPLSEFLDWHSLHREDGKPWRLLLNGDIVDFVAITAVPGPHEEVPFAVTPEERSIGLSQSELKCVWKLRRTAERHPRVFDAFARFVQRGNSLHIVRGNHDSEWRWPLVQEEFRRLLGERCSVPRRKLARLVEFHDWFYLEPGYVYAEHGHAHDRYSVHSDFFEDHDQQVDLPLSSKVLRYFANRYTEQVELPDNVDAWGVRDYLDWVLKAGNPLRIAADYFVMVFRVLYPIGWQSMKLSRAFARKVDKAIASKRPDAHVRKLLLRFQGTEHQANALAQIASRPAEESLFDSMQLFYLDRMLLALLCLACAYSTSLAAASFTAKALSLTCVGIVFAALNALLGARRKTDAHPMLIDAARRVAQIFDVKFVVMGHSHRPVDTPVGNLTRYLNSGSWTGRSKEGFPHVRIVGGTAELRRWNGPPTPESVVPQPPSHHEAPVGLALPA
jgi:UDP-2,3-diacylglucosamine pyrophosphatase LpxH